MNKNYKLLFGIIIFLLLLCIFVSRKSIMEGLTTYTLADYANLSPINDDNKNQITDSSWAKYLNMYFSFCDGISPSSPNKCQYSRSDNMGDLQDYFYDIYTDSEFNELMNNMSASTNEKESGLATSSITNNKYLIDWLTQNKLPYNVRSNLPPSNRQVYEKYLLATEKDMDPPPQSYQIYSGPDN